MLQPDSPEALAALLREHAEAGRTIRLGGADSKVRIGGPPRDCDVSLSTLGLRRVLQFEPRDLTISVQAGLPWAELTRLLDDAGMMVPIDPPFASRATVGGVVAANSSGPRRRLYGTARDLVIGMTFATLEGKLVQTGGMVVKNVAGLDMAKLMIGSFGTLAAIVSVNFKLIPKPQAREAFLIQAGSLEDAVQWRNRILTSVLQPAALDLLNPAAAQRVGLDNSWCLLLEAAGSEAVIGRYRRELGTAQTIGGDIWERIREFTPDWLAGHPEARILRFSTTLQGLADVFRFWRGPMIARAASGVAWGYSEKPLALPGGLRYVVEAGDALLPWPGGGVSFTMMEKIKQMFDPKHLLNPGRLYVRI
jgi:glycolate oxidase FAD binding subunit